MLVPALLLRDYGPWGWFAFAIPNVIGAMAMGLVLTPQRSTRLTTRHRDMGLRFTEVTIAYHGFVMGWLYPALLGWWTTPAVVLLMVVAWLAVRGVAGAKLVAVAVSIVSLAVLGYATTFDGAWRGVSFEAPTRLTGRDLALFAPASVLGFLLCPYLDLTFHRARQAAAGATGRIAFVFGFGVVFLLMIAGSLMYAGVIYPFLSMPITLHSTLLPEGWRLVFGIHLVLQTAFTLAIHVREGTRIAGRAAWWRLGLVLAAGYFAGTIVLQSGRLVHGLRVGEAGYRLFLLAYGLPLPAYVWLCIIPTLRRDIRPRARTLVWAVATLLALPASYAAFLLAWSWGIPITIGILLVARIVVELLPADDPGTIPARAADAGAQPGRDAS